MKKYGVFIFVSILLLTGCGKKEVLCSATFEEDGSSAKVEITAKLKSKKITSASAKLTFDDENFASQYCQVLGISSAFMEENNDKLDFKCDGKIITISNYDKVVESGNVKLKGLKIEEFEKTLREQTQFDNLTCK